MRKATFWPGPGATELTDTSLPAAKVNSGGFMHKPVTEITRNADGTVSFWVMKTPLPAVAAPTGLDCEVISSTAVNVSWTAVDDSDVTYTLEIKQHKDIELLMSTDFTVNSHGWATSGFTEISPDGIRMGSSKAMGAVTSPAVKTAADGLVTVKFTAKYYTGDESSVDLMWYLWCGAKSPLFGRDRMTTFERRFIADEATHVEAKTPTTTCTTTRRCARAF